MIGMWNDALQNPPLVFRNWEPSLLLADPTRLNTRGGQVTAPIFPFLRQVKRQERLNLARDTQ